MKAKKLIISCFSFLVYTFSPCYVGKVGTIVNNVHVLPLEIGYKLPQPWEHPGAVPAQILLSSENFIIYR